MKTIFLLTSLFAGIFNLKGQEGLKLLKFSEVVNVDSSATKEQLFGIAKEFIGAFSDGKTPPVIDKDLWKVSAHPFYFRNGVKVTGTYFITVEVKDGKYKYTIYNFYEDDGIGLVFDGYCKEKEDECVLAKEAATKEANTYIELLRKGMSTIHKDNW